MAQQPDPVLDPIRPRETPATPARPTGSVGRLRPDLLARPRSTPVMRPPPATMPDEGRPRPGLGSRPSGPVVRPPPIKPVSFNPKIPGGSLPVEPGSPNGASGSGGNYVSGMAPNVSRRRGLTRYSNPVHPSSSRRRGY